MFKPLSAYKPDLQKTLSVMSNTYESAANRRGGNVTFRALPPSDVALYSEFDLTAFNYDMDIDDYAHALCRMYAASFDVRTRIDDNMVPAVTPVLGIGDYSAFVAGEIFFQKDTSWSKPVLSHLQDMKTLPPIGESPWYGRFLRITKEILIHLRESGIPFTRGFFSPLDLAAALRGEAIYTDFYEDPDGVSELLDFCATATIRFAEDIYSLVDRELGRSPYGLWYLNGNINMSEDIACMISGKLYRTLCAPHTQRVIDHFGRGHMHSHSRALYLVKEICSLRNVVNLWLATDPNQPRPIEHLDRLVADADGVCLAIDCDSFDEIEEHADILKKGNFSICLPVKDPREGETLANRFNRLFFKP
ncbi:MAG TPA: uroporphyrinogen decarboxylase family protein [Thermotogota bacterium]|nr:uroporphyrinogen decarboxylase family protein [Thermotogota bacterium]